MLETVNFGNSSAHKQNHINRHLFYFTLGHINFIIVYLINYEIQSQDT
jgi:hypothetical protein